MTRLERARTTRQCINLGVSSAIESGTVLPDKLVGVVDRWRPGREHVAGEVCEDNGVLYRCVQSHTAQSDWQPANTPALWVNMGVSADDPDALPEWKQPTGAHDAYAMGAVVRHNGKTWSSDIAANTYEPGVAYWTEVADE